MKAPHPLGPPAGAPSTSLSGSSPSATATRSEEYVLRLPAAAAAAPAYDHVPALWHDARAPAPIHPPVAFPFLRGVDWAAVVADGNRALQEWSYSARWHAQRVLPFLLLGPTSVCRDADFLRGARVGMIVVVRQLGPAGARPLGAALEKARTSGAVVRAVDVASTQQLCEELRGVIAAMNAHLSGPAALADADSVLLCCESGSSRSAALAVAYCMETLGIPLGAALKLVQSSRFCIGFDDSLYTALRSYADILQARRDVQQVTGTSYGAGAPGGAVAKRARDSGADEDAEIGWADDRERFQDRAFAPFHG